MKILVLATEAFHSNGGIAQFNRNLVNALSDISSTYEIFVLPRKVGSMSAELTNNIVHYPQAARSNYDYIRHIIRLSAVKFDLIICGHINLLPVSYVIKMFNKTPLVLTVHGIDAWNKHKSSLVNYLINKVDFFWSVSRTTRNRMTDWSGVNINKFYIIPNTINLDLYKPGKKSDELLEKYQLHGKKVVMFLGRLSKAEKYKGVDEIIECAEKVVREDSNVRFLILGDGDDKQRLENKTYDLHLDKFIFFTGFVTESEKILFYRSSDLFVMPGKGEGFGIVYLEALACGIPVIGSLLDGSKDALKEGKLGKLVNPNNAEEIIRAIIDELHNPTKISRSELDYFALPAFKERVKNNINSILNTKIK